MLLFPAIHTIQNRAFTMLQCIDCDILTHIYAHAFSTGNSLVVFISIISRHLQCDIEKSVVLNFDDGILTTHNTHLNLSLHSVHQ